MTDKEVVLALAKVMIAAAWLDGAISPQEYGSLRQWLSPLQLSALEWARLEMYLTSPVGEAERERLIHELSDLLHTDEEKEQVGEALLDVIEADGTVTDDERTIVGHIVEAIAQVDVSALGKLGRVVRQAVQKRQHAAADAPNRESQFDEFVHNRVYYRVCERLAQKQLNLSEAELRKLSLAGGLLARVAQVDQQVVASEIHAIEQALRDNWGVSDAAAVFVTEVAIAETQEGLDYYQLIEGLKATTSEQERIQFLQALFAVAQADKSLFHEESEQIRRIARGLDLTREQFMTARGRSEG